MTQRNIRGMAVCKHTGKPLPPNLYNDPKGRKDCYRYRRPDGSYKTVRLPFSKAVEAAKQANAKRDAPEGTLVYWVEQYRQWQVDRDDVAHLVEKKKPAKQRKALTLGDFWAIHELADPHVRIAMMISLTTTMREGDIVCLRFDDIEDGYLCRTIAKSVGQRGAAAAAHLKWSLAEHAGLKAAIDEARELSMRHRRCPYIVSRPRRRASDRLAQGHTHTHQCGPEHISRGFKRARDATGRWPDNGPTFHEIRGLAISLLLQQGHDMAAVQRLAAHTDPSITSAYTAGQAPHYLDMAGLVVSAGKSAGSK